MNSCDLNLDLFTEEVLDLIISRYTNYSILKERTGYSICPVVKL